MKKVYYNGKIITMAEPLYCDAVLVEDGIITAAGDKNYVLSKASVHTKEIELIDLKGYIICLLYTSTRIRTWTNRTKTCCATITP